MRFCHRVYACMGVARLRSQLLDSSHCGGIMQAQLLFQRIFCQSGCSRSYQSKLSCMIFWIGALAGLPCVDVDLLRL